MNLNEESSLLFSSEVILDAEFVLVMTGIDHSDRMFMMISFMSCVLKCFVLVFAWPLVNANQVYPDRAQSLNC